MVLGFTFGFSLLKWLMYFEFSKALCSDIADAFEDVTGFSISPDVLRLCSRGNILDLHQCRRLVVVSRVREAIEDGIGVMDALFDVADRLSISYESARHMWYNSQELLK